MIRDNLSIGITLKSLYEKLFIEETVGLAGDLGILWNVWEKVDDARQLIMEAGPFKPEDLKGRIGSMLVNNIQ